MSKEEKKGFLSEIKNQVITTIGIIITAVGGIVVTNLENWFTPDEPEVIQEVVDDSSEESQQPIININIPPQESTKEKVIIKEVPVEKEKEKEDVDW
jgi:hypothetical protein